jgi:hypothetical protein
MGVTLDPPLEESNLTHLDIKVVHMQFFTNHLFVALISFKICYSRINQLP